MATVPTPATMRALVLHAYDPGSYASLTLEERPTPHPGRGAVLVRMAASPINPSDLAALQGLYGVPKALPVVPGIEGCGTVVRAGSGYLARRLLGKRVACAAGAGDGAWAEYMVAPARQCSPLPTSVSDEQGAMRIVNPYTAWAHLTIARQARARTIVQTAAASALGRMVNRLAQLRGMQVINIVRRDAQAQTLRALGAKHILNSEAPDFDPQLRDLCRQLDARLAFDAVAGSMTVRLLNALPPEGRVVVYGGLAGEIISLNPGDLIFNQRRVEGFYLARWVARQNPLALLAMQRQLYKLGDLTHATIQLRARLEEVQHAIATYEASMSAGKVLLMPGLSATQGALFTTPPP
jgi:NADPH:quinone reductase-like Zn-dependent oxidoreductase